jgi:hypothetical protein
VAASNALDLASSGHLPGGFPHIFHGPSHGPVMPSHVQRGP